MSFLQKISSVVMLSILLVQTTSANNVLQRQPGNNTPDSLENIPRDVAENLIDEAVFQNFANLAGPACSLYGLGIDLVNFFYDGQWSILDPVLEMSTLFRNQAWRELIWAVNDQRDVYVEELTSLKKRRCVIGFSLPEARAKDPGQAAQREQQLLQLDRQVVELSAKIDYFGLQRKNLAFDQPKFPVIDSSLSLEQTLTAEQLQVDKMFYWLFNIAKIDWELFALETKQFILRTFEDFTVVVQNVPDTCFAVVNLVDQLWMYFSFNFSLDTEKGVYKDSSGTEYASFREFLEKNSSAITRSYVDKVCQAPDPRNPPPPRGQTSVEQQYQRFLQMVESVTNQMSERLKIKNASILALQQKRTRQGTLNPNDERLLTELQTQAGTLQGGLEYYALVVQHIGSPTSQSLTALSESLTNLVEAVLGVEKDRQGRLKSRISVSEKFQQSKERQLQKICGRIEAMYRQAGRDTSQLPIIGNANGFTFCRANPNCEDVNLSNFFGGSEGRKKLAECSGFLFDSGELGFSQQTEDVLRESGNDIGLLLEQRSLNDLLKLRNLHYTSLYQQYQAIYQTDTGFTAKLDNQLNTIKNDLCGEGPRSTSNPECGTEVYNPNGTTAKNHLSLLRKIYQDFWLFCDQQEGSCTAPEKPED